MNSSSVKQINPWIGFTLVIGLIFILINIDGVAKKAHQHIQKKRDLANIEERLEENKIEKATIKDALLARKRIEDEIRNDSEHKKVKKIIKKLYKSNNLISKNSSNNELLFKRTYKKYFTPEATEDMWYIKKQGGKLKKLAIEKEEKFSIIYVEDLGYPLIYKASHCLDEKEIEVTIKKVGDHTNWKLHKLDITDNTDLQCNEEDKEITITEKEKEFYKNIQLYKEKDSNFLLAFEYDKEIKDIAHLLQKIIRAEKILKEENNKKYIKEIYKLVYTPEFLDNVHAIEALPYEKSNIIKEMSKKGIYQVKALENGYKLYNCNYISDSDQKIMELSIIKDKKLKILALNEIDKPENFECKYINFKKKTTANKFKVENDKKLIIESDFDIPDSIIKVIKNHLALDKTLRTIARKGRISYNNAQKIYSKVYTDEEVANILKFSVDKFGKHQAIQDNKSLHIIYNDYTYSQIQLFDHDKKDNIISAINCAPYKTYGEKTANTVTFFTHFEKSGIDWKIKDIAIDMHGDYDGECKLNK